MFASACFLPSFCAQLVTRQPKDSRILTPRWITSCIRTDRVQGRQGGVQILSGGSTNETGAKEGSNPDGLTYPGRKGPLTISGTANRMCAADGWL
jgi:hypothetical protein